ARSSLRTLAARSGTRGLRWRAMTGRSPPGSRSISPWPTSPEAPVIRMEAKRDTAAPGEWSARSASGVFFRSRSERTTLYLPLAGGGRQDVADDVRGEPAVEPRLRVEGDVGDVGRQLADEPGQVAGAGQHDRVVRVD